MRTRLNLYTGVITLVFCVTLIAPFFLNAPPEFPSDVPAKQLVCTPTGFTWQAGAYHHDYDCALCYLAAHTLTPVDAARILLAICPVYTRLNGLLSPDYARTHTEHYSPRAPPLA